MELKEIQYKRRSVRHFLEKKVSQEMIQELLMAGMSGPSAANKQPWEFYVIQDEELLKTLKTATKYTNYDAPLIIAVCGNQDHFVIHPFEDYWVQDCSAATQNILLRAVDLGLGTVWCGVYPQLDEVNKVKEMLHLENKIIPLNLIFIGYPEKESKPQNYYDEKKVHYL